MAVSSRHIDTFPSSATTSQKDNPQIMTLPARPAISPDDINVSNDVSKPYATIGQEDRMKIVPPKTPGRLQEHVSTNDRTVHKVENEAPNIMDASSDAPIAVQEDNKAISSISRVIPASQEQGSPGEQLADQPLDEFTLQEDVELTDSPSELIATSDESDIQQRDLVIQRIDQLKSKNKNAIAEVARVRTEVNRHLVECQDHCLQLTQWRFVYGPAISVITIGHNNTISAYETHKIALASKLVEHDIKRIGSLSAFYRTQKQYFRLLEVMKKTEGEIQEASGEASREFMDSKERVEMLEQSRVQVTETWLEWLEELA
ncbi:hypothetical protein D6D12_09048 [Aureobasidium pullulans]|uniref:Uncharacterized protein n=1 Tax=Aureobasidium pullulans TaxID=5580 RepID=A0AB74JI21_AURPU|nr:hypothetical protein D6D12_09048 [Aureobasidium pullulans]THX42157.1 hypothetical protein D6D11_08321 [Aureobasidium pullulans]